eukprot:7793597-Pyramimonas_sp.AAC.1
MAIRGYSLHRRIGWSRAARRASGTLVACAASGPEKCSLHCARSPADGPANSPMRARHAWWG